MIGGDKSHWINGGIFWEETVGGMALLGGLAVPFCVLRCQRQDNDTFIDFSNRLFLAIPNPISYTMIRLRPLRLLKTMCISLSSQTLVHRQTRRRALVDEIHAEEMQQQAPEHKVRKRPLMTDALELLLVLRVRLDAQTGREHELADRGAEAGEEGVEGIVADEHAIDKLQPAHREQEGHEDVNQLHALRRRVEVVPP